MEKEIVIHPKYTFKEFVLPIKQKLLGSFGFYLVVIIALGMLVFDIVFLFDNSIFENQKIPFLNIVLPIMVFIVFPLFFYFALRKSFRNNYLLKEETTVTYNLDGINTQGESYLSFVTWDKIKSIKEHRKYFNFKNIDGQDSVLPKTFFSDEKLEKFKLLIKELKF